MKIITLDHQNNYMR